MASNEMTPASHESASRHNRQTPSIESNRARMLAGLPVTERRLVLNKVSTAVLEGGKGPPIVLLHGPSGYAAHWFRVIPHLVGTHHVIAPDLPGHGASARCPGAPDSDALLGWLDDLIECTCSAPPILVGQAIGGAIAARFASEWSVRLRALVLVNTLGLRTFQPLPDFGSALEAFLAAPTTETHQRLWSQCALDLPALRRELAQEWDALEAYNLECAQEPGQLSAVADLMAHFGIPAIPPPVLARITTPTTLIWGREDRATPIRVAAEASVRYGWELRAIGGAADDPTIEQPLAFVSALRAVIASHAAATSDLMRPAQ
jgi:pimeloyl-ACP methyl ester carboxylesterase